MTPPRARPARGHESLRDIKLRNQQSLDLYADLSDRPRVALNIPPPPKPRAPAGGSGVPLEADVTRDIVAGLLRHPKVGLVERINSGSAVETGADGAQRHIAFHHIYRGKGMRAPDLSVTLRTGRRFVIEVKRPGWKRPRDEREREQAAYIEHIIQCGGHGMFATSWAEVEHALREI